MQPGNKDSGAWRGLHGPWVSVFRKVAQSPGACLVSCPPVPCAPPAAPLCSRHITELSFPGLSEPRGQGCCVSLLDKRGDWGPDSLTCLGVQMVLQPLLSQCSPSQPTTRVPWLWTEAEVTGSPLTVVPGGLSCPGGRSAVEGLPDPHGQKPA